MKTEMIEQAIEDRKKALKEKDFEVAEGLRQMLLDRG